MITSADLHELVCFLKHVISITKLYAPVFSGQKLPSKLYAMLYVGYYVQPSLHGGATYSTAQACPLDYQM